MTLNRLTTNPKPWTNGVNAMCKLFETVQSALVDNIASLDLPYAGDLHHALYNEPHHYIYYADAKEVTAELNIWECVEVVQTYEKDQFGEVYTPYRTPAVLPIWLCILWVMSF